MSFDAFIERMRAHPNVEVEEIWRDGQKPPGWREFFIAQNFRVMDVDAFLTWLKHNKDAYVAFENATIAHIKAGEDVSAISIMDEISVDHNRTPWFTRMVMRRVPAARGYFRTKQIKRAA